MAWNGKGFSQHLHRFTSLEALQTQHQEFLWRHNGLNHWTLVMASTFSPFSATSPAPPPGGGSGVGLNIPTFLALGWFPWQPASILRGFPKSHLINISSEVFERACYMSNKRLLFISSLSFLNYLGTENKTKYYNKRCPYGS